MNEAHLPDAQSRGLSCLCPSVIPKKWARALVEVSGGSGGVQGENSLRPNGRPLLYECAAHMAQLGWRWEEEK